MNRCVSVSSEDVMSLEKGDRERREERGITREGEGPFEKSPTIHSVLMVV